MQRSDLFDVKRPRFSFSFGPVPIKDAKRGIAVLLDFDNQISRANRVDATTGQKHCITVCTAMRWTWSATGLCAKLVRISRVTILRAARQKFRVRFGVSNVPNSVLASPPIPAPIRWRMHLPQKVLLRVEQFYEERKTRGIRHFAKDFGPVLAPKFM